MKKVLLWLTGCLKDYNKAKANAERLQEENKRLTDKYDSQQEELETMCKAFMIQKNRIEVLEKEAKDFESQMDEINLKNKELETLLKEEKKMTTHLKKDIKKADSTEKPTSKVPRRKRTNGKEKND